MVSEPASTAARDGGLSAFLTGILRQEYRCNATAADVRSVARGRNHIYSVRSSRGLWIIKVGKGAAAVERIRREAAVLVALSQINASVPKPILTNAGTACVTDQDGDVAVLVTDEAEGRTAPETVDGFARLGSALAELHMQTDHLPPAQVDLPRFDPQTILSDVGKRIQARLPDAPSRTRYVLMSEFIDRGLAGTRDLWAEASFGHGDAHVYNLFLAPKGHVWIDLEDAYLGPRLYDLGTLVWSSLRHKETQPLWSSGLAAYLAQRPVTAGKLDCIGLFVALRHVWWLGLHAAHWGDYVIHHDQPQFFDSGVDLLEIICRDACGM